MSYILLLILPYDIVEYIDIISKQKKACAIIMNYYKNYRDKIGALKVIVKMIITETYHYYDIRDDIEFNLYKYLKIIGSSSYNREKYNHYFWQCFLHMLSKMLMYFYETLNIYHYTSNNNTGHNIYTIILKQSTKLWFSLCNKYNMKLAFKFRNKNLSIKHNNFVYTKARNILKITNFNKFLYSPYILDNEEFFIENNFAINHIMHVSGVA